MNAEDFSAVHHPVSSGAKRLWLSLCKLLQPRDCSNTEERVFFLLLFLLSSNFGVLFQHVQFVFLSWVKCLWSGTMCFTAAVFVCMGNSSHLCSGRGSYYR